MFDLDFGVQIYSVKLPIKSNSVISGHVSHRWTSAFNYHFDDSFVVLKIVQLRFTMRRMCVGGYVVHLTQLSTFCLLVVFWVGFGIKNFPLITREISFGQNVSELVFGVDVPNFNLESRLILSNSQPRATV